MTIAFVEDTIYNLCDRHQVLYRPDQVCSRCAGESHDCPCAYCETLRQHAAAQREALNVLESRIADHDSKISGLSRHVLDVQRAHNAEGAAVALVTADHDSEISALRRHINDLRHIVLDLQRAQNIAQRAP